MNMRHFSYEGYSPKIKKCMWKSQSDSKNRGCIFHCFQTWLQRSYLQVLQKCFVVVIIDKAAKNFAFICKIYYISKLLAELDLSNSKSKTYSKAAHSIEETIQANISYCKKFDLNITELDQWLTIMHWLPKYIRHP